MPRSLINIYSSVSQKRYPYHIRMWRISLRLKQIRNKMKKWRIAVRDEEYNSFMCASEHPELPDDLTDLRAARRNLRKHRFVYVAATMLYDLYAKEIEGGEE